MAGLSDYTENKLLDWFYRGVSWTVPTSFYVRLYSTNPTDWESMGGSPVEMVATGYTQYGQAYANGTNGANWTIASQGSYGGMRMTNDNELTWTAGAADWENITGVGVFDGNLVGSNLLFGGSCSITGIGNGDTIRLAAGAIDIDFDVSTNKHGVTTYVNTKMAQKLSGDNTLTPPATVYVALYTTTPDVKDGSGGTEVTVAGGYSRTALTSSSAWDAASGGAIQNAAQIDWTTSSTSWGTILGAALVDTASGAVGNYYAVDAFSSSVVMTSGDDFYIADGAFGITLD